MVQALVGLRAWGPSRSLDLRALQFGQAREGTTRSGEPRVTGEWALHVQCDWRLSRADEPVASAGDPIERGDRAFFDAFRAEGDRVVTRAVIEGSRLRIEFSGDVVLEAFAAEGDEEAWRIFRPGRADPHFVFYGTGSQLE